MLNRLNYLLCVTPGNENMGLSKYLPSGLPNPSPIGNNMLFICYSRKMG